MSLWRIGLLATAGLLIPLDAAGAAEPARPGHSIQVPEPADCAIFVAGIAGLLIGRRGSRGKRPKK